MLRHTLLRRTGSPEEVADAVMFLVRDAEFMTGSVVRMDGGFYLGGEHVSDMPEGVLNPQKG
jgi:3-oxoacyl-[acyl-carrier protein] reductase